MSVGRRDSHRLYVKHAESVGLFQPGQPHRDWGWMGLISWTSMGRQRGPEPNKGAMGGQYGRKNQDSDSAVHLPPSRAIASMVGIWPDQVQNLGQLLFCPWFKLKQGFVRVNSLASQLVDHVCPPSLGQAGASGACRGTAEGEGTAIWEDDLGREDSWAGAPLQAVVSFLSLERHRKIIHVCEPISLSCSSTTSRAPEPSKARGRAHSGAKACASYASAGASITSE